MEILTELLNSAISRANFSSFSQILVIVHMSVVKEEKSCLIEPPDDYELLIDFLVF